MSGMTNQDFRRMVATRKRKDREAIEAFVALAGESDMSAFSTAYRTVRERYLLRPAFRAIVRAGSVHPEIASMFAVGWVPNGDGIRNDINHDLSLLDALWVLLPRYEGGSVMLYRGETAWNRKRRTYGMAWSSEKGTALSFALGTMRHMEGGSVLISAEVPASAIVYSPAMAGDHYGEQEYIVDRRKMAGRPIRVEARFGQLDIDENPADHVESALRAGGLEEFIPGAHKSSCGLCRNTWGS